MNLPLDQHFALLIYKLACITSGLFFCFLGYRLFALGIFGSAGDLDSQFRNSKLVLKKAAPGTFFALFGAVIIAGTVMKGLDLKTIASAVAGTTTTQEANGLAPIAPTETGANFAAKRTDAQRTMAELNNLPKLLQSDVPKSKLLDLNQAIRASKLAIVLSVWGADWGDIRKFRNWVDEGESETISADLKGPVALFRQGE